MDDYGNWNELSKLLDEAEDNSNRQSKSFRELLREYPHVPGIRMMAQREYEGLQCIVEASKYVGAYGWISPTGRPRQDSVFSTKPPMS